MSAVHSLKPLTFTEYLTLEAASDTRHELVNGYLHAMGGASDRHPIVAGNLAAHLSLHLRGTPCVVTAADMKVRDKVPDLHVAP
jgi:Uma2 family endonuclease